MKKHYYKDDILDICNEKHLTVEEIFKEISEKHPDAGKSSIYRNVEQMFMDGELRKVVGIGKKAYFEKNVGDHVHLVDINTGKIIDLKENSISIPNLPENFKISDMDIKIFGEFTSYSGYKYW